MPRPYKSFASRRKRTPYDRKSSRAMVLSRRRTRSARQYKATPVGGFPKSKLVKLRYCEQITINPSAGVNGVHVFSANGMYDPSVTSVGHQPSNFDRWMANYDHYTVIGSKITVSYMPSITTTVIPGIFGVLLSDQGNEVVSLSQENLLEQPRCVFNRKVVGVPTDLQNQSYVTKRFSAKRFFGVNPVGGGKTFQGSASANPTEGAYYEVFVAPINSNDPGAMYFTCVIDYIALLTEPNITDAS